jgi:hypothetical protein
MCLAARMYTILIFRDAIEGGFFHETWWVCCGLLACWHLAASARLLALHFILDLESIIYSRLSMLYKDIWISYFCMPIW